MVFQWVNPKNADFAKIFLSNYFGSLKKGINFALAFGKKLTSELVKRKRRANIEVFAID